MILIALGLAAFLFLVWFIGWVVRDMLAHPVMALIVIGIIGGYIYWAAAINGPIQERLAALCYLGNPPQWQINECLRKQ